MILVKVNEESFKMSVSSRLGYYGECFATKVGTTLTLAIGRLIGKGIMMAVMPARL